MTRTNTRTTKPALTVKQKLRAEIEQLEAVISKMSPLQRQESPEFTELCDKSSRLRGDPKHHYESSRIDRADATLRGSWTGASVDVPVDTDWSDEERDTTYVEADGCRDGWRYGVLSEAPEDQGPRFNKPGWLCSSYLRYTFGERLLRAYKKEHPTLVDFLKSKAAIQTQILFDYFMDHFSYEEIYDKYRQPKNDIYDVSTKDAKTVQEAIEYSAEKNGTLTAFRDGGDVLWIDEDGEKTKVTPSWFDMVEHKFKLVTARKVNAEIFRVEIHNEVENTYYLPEKLDPTKKGSIRPLARYIADLAAEGYELMKMPKPDATVRAIKRQTRQAEEEMVIAKNQLGEGTNPGQWEHTDTLDQNHVASQAETLHAAYRHLASVENWQRRNVQAREIDHAMETMTPEQFNAWEQRRHDAIFEDFLKRTKVEEAVARFSRPWQPPVEPEPVVETKPAVVRTQYQAPAVRHEVLRMSIQLFLDTVGHTPTGQVAIPAAA